MGRDQQRAAKWGSLTGGRTIGTRDAHIRTPKLPSV